MWAATAYESLASEYYTDFHPDSRLFGALTWNFLLSEQIFCDRGSIHLEVGAGEGKLAKLKAFHDCRLIVSDISFGMLRNAATNCGSHNVLKVVASAFQLPFPSSLCSGVYSLLGDPYALPEFFTEAFRVLQPNRKLLYIGPTTKWGHTLRKQLGIDVNITVFATREGQSVKAPSFLYHPEEMKQVLIEAGFSIVNHQPLFLSPELMRNVLPQHILIPCDALGLKPHELPMLDAFWATK